ncbi:WD repeat-containing protein pop1 [Lophium mytilinum]|uniref:WD repeat-containing protein pop1 n=1 Tax=Lophium mytilinum TaxID=390894 RepID=A0A6A6QLS4_9PEZI|nr:WD repeat-containing protein pop1 [Lophium mytilinum]
MEASYATLGQLSYVPTTHTTVVTTTTTTKIDFPPILLRAPRSLVERDPKIYPLACSPAPESVRRFAFDAGGTQAYFSEADDVQQSLKEYNARHDALTAANGRVESIQHYNAQYETPNRTTQSSGMTGVTLTDPLTRPLSGRRKRSSSPPSIAEAAELASLQRKSKKARATILGSQDAEGTVPATPDTDTGTSGRFKIPKIKGGSRRSNLRSSNQGESSGSGKQTLGESQLLPDAWGLREAEARQSLANQTRNLSTANSGEGATPAHESRFHAAVLDGPGISATPPIAETDMEPAASFSSSDAPFARPARPAPLDTVLTQDASLPSPSLSPITAAANLAHNANHNSLRGGDGQEEDPYEVSILDLSEDRSDQANGLTKLQTRSASRMQRIDLPDRLDGASPNPQLPTPTVMGIPAMLDSFDSMPEQMKTYVMFHLLRRCTKPTLHFVADVVNPALKCDFLGLLPLELGLNVLKYLDVKSMCNAAQVSRKWRHIVDTDETAWKDLLAKDGYDLPDGDLERAVKEGWGWQYPHSSESYERDLRASAYTAKSDADSPGSSGSSTVGSYADSEGAASTKAISTRPKRKATSLKLGSSKKQRRKGPTTSKAQAPSWSRSLGNAHGPIAVANIAISAVPNPNIGLPSLRSLHLFKSLYTRHHLIRKSWMEEETRPKHIAFRAHQRHVVTCLQFDTDKILTGSDDTNINVYDTKSGALRSHLEGHEGGVWALQYEGNTLVSGSTDRSVRVWDIEKGKCTHVFQGHTSTVRCLVILNPTPTGEIVDGLPVMMPKEPLIITGSRDSSLRVWKLPQPGERSIIQTGPPANDADNQYFVRALTGHHHSVRAIAAHGDTLISGSYDCTVRVWKISTGETVHRLQGHAQKVYSVVLDHARKRCISGSMDNMVKVWSLETGQCLFNLEGHTSLVGLLDLSHERLVSAAADSTLRIWDPENGQCKSTLSAHTGAITCFQHDGQKVISGSDRTLKMWNVKTGECVKDLLTDLSGVWQVKFNERRCVAAVQRNNMTYIEVLDFGASRDGVPADQRGRRIVVNAKGREIEDLDEARARGAEDIEEVVDADAP